MQMYQGYRVMLDANMLSTRLCFKSRISKSRSFKKRAKKKVMSYKSCPSKQVIIDNNLNVLLMHPATARALKDAT